MTIGIQGKFTEDRGGFGCAVALKALAGMSYELRFKNHGGHTFSVSALHAASDRQAIDKARRVYRCGIGDHYEIWREGVLIHIEAERASVSA